MSAQLSVWRDSFLPVTLVQAQTCLGVQLQPPQQVLTRYCGPAGKSVKKG